MSAPARPRPPAWRILIAGAGLPSLALAAALRRTLPQTVVVTICDPSLAGPRRDARAYALSLGASAMLDGLGVWAEIRGSVQPITGMTITDSRADDAVRPSYLGFGDGDDALGFTVEAAVLGDALAARCREAGVQFRSAALATFEAGPREMALTFADGGHDAATLLVAADGGRSRLREAAGISWVGGTYRQSGIVATLRHAREHGGRAVQHFLPAGPFALLPLPARDGDCRSSLVWTESEGRAADLVAAPPAEALGAVQARIGATYGRLALETPLFAHPLAVGLARRFVRPRFALLGDAAHEIHPLAGQGLNLGLADAAALAERIVDAVRLGLDPGGDEVLAGYERDRRFDAVLLAGATDGLNRLFSSDSLPLRFVRDLGLGLVDRTPGLKRFFEAQAAGRTRRAPRLMRGEAL